MLRRITWPKLIAGIVTAAGLLLTVSWAAVWSSRVVMNSTRFDWAEMVLAALGVVCLALSYPLYTARVWAFRVLVGLVACIGVATLVFAVWFVAHPPEWSDGPPPEDFRRAMQIQRISDIANIFWLVIPPVFFLLILLHPDVVAAFKAPYRDENANI